MEKTTVLARLRLTIALTEATQVWLHQHFGNDPDRNWIAVHEGSLFLSRHEDTWRALFRDAAEPIFRNYFRSLGVPEEYLPFIQYGDAYRGSWELEAALTMNGTIGTVYTVLQPMSILAIAENLLGLKDKIRSKLSKEVNEEISQWLQDQAASTQGNDTGTQGNMAGVNVNVTSAPVPAAKNIPPPPPTPAAVNFVIDARPIKALTPAKLKTHQVHLSVAISRDSFTLENLGDSDIRDVRIGLFKSRIQRFQFNYGESYQGNFPIVSGKQTIAKDLAEFRDNANYRFDLSDGEAVFVDCWVSDSQGIYVLHFFLEDE